MMVGVTTQCRLRSTPERCNMSVMKDHCLTPHVSFLNSKANEDVLTCVLLGHRT